MFTLVAPFVVLMIAGGIWMALQSTRENYRLARGAQQIFEIVATARGLEGSLSQQSDDEALRVLFERLPFSSGLQGSRRGDSWGLPNPWGSGVMDVRVQAWRSLLTLAMPLSVPACRRLLAFLTERDVRALGLARIETHALDSGGTSFEGTEGRLVYEEPRSSAGPVILRDAAIIAGCGTVTPTLLALTFRLR